VSTESPEPELQEGEPANDSDVEPASPEDIPRSREILEEIANAVESSQHQSATQKALKELKKVYETSIKPLETVYKYSDLTSRIFGGTFYICHWHTINKLV
jgi:hypothetical protein